MTPLDSQILKAFLKALIEIDSPLPPDLIQKINQVGDALVNQQTAEVGKLEAIAHRHVRLRELYESACINLQEQYQPQELNRFFSPDKKTASDSKPPDLLENIAAPILQTPEPPTEAKKRKSDIMPAIQPLL